MNHTNSTASTETSRLLIHIPDSWQRLISVIRHQANSGHFIFIEGQHTSGKSTFAQILLKKLTLVDELDAHYQKLHPLVSAQQVWGSLPEHSELLPVVILDDANEVDASVIEELITSNLGYFFVILAEPELVNRVPRLQNSRFNLPLFNKEDCHKLLTKMYHAIDRSIEIPKLESELVYYESKGFPGEVKKLGQSLKSKLKRKTSSLKSFELANKGVFSTAVIIGGLAIFIFYLFLSSPKEETPVEQPLVPEMISEAVDEKVVEDQKLITGELQISESVVRKPKTFVDWVADQDPEDFTIQLYSNASESKAQAFKQALDLADSYVYLAELNDQNVYRVVWGVYPNRARAQLAIQSLPSEILEQKPWLRSFKSIVSELVEKP